MEEEEETVDASRRSLNDESFLHLRIAALNGTALEEVQGLGL
jgi:hypothetical protein